KFLGAAADEFLELFLSLAKDFIRLPLERDLLGHADAAVDPAVRGPRMRDASPHPARFRVMRVDPELGCELVGPVLRALPLGQYAVAIGGVNHLPPDPSRLRGVEKVGGGAPAAIGVAEAAGRVGDEDAAGSMMAQEVEQIAALPLGVSGALL